MVLGGGPLGLGAVIWLKLRGVQHVAVADVTPARLHTALTIGAGAVIDPSREDIPARLAELHGHGPPRTRTQNSPFCAAPSS